MSATAIRMRTALSERLCDYERLLTTVLIEQLAAQPESGRATLPKFHPNKPALAGQDLDGQFTAILADHDPFQVLGDRGAEAAVVLELFGTTMDAAAGVAANARNRRSRRHL
jgi:hypothetical protein